MFLVDGTSDTHVLWWVPPRPPGRFPLRGGTTSWSPLFVVSQTGKGSLTSHVAVPWVDLQMAHVNTGLFPVAKPDRWLHPGARRARKRPLPVCPELAAAEPRANGRSAVLFKSQPCLPLSMRLGTTFRNFLTCKKATQYLPCSRAVQA